MLQDHFGKGTALHLSEMRVMVIGAHPDDPDVNAGATAARLVKNGARVTFVAVTSGNLGHQTMSPAALAARRAGEAAASARTLGIEDYIILGLNDCEVEANLDLRRKITNTIREFAPHIVVTHRPCDYHCDHRATGQVVLDAGYLLGVPHWCPETKCPERLPAILLMRDTFTNPREMRPDVLVDCDPFIDTWADAMRCHESQFFEWLPFDRGIENEVPARGDAAAERAFIMKYWGVRKTIDRDRFGSVWAARHPDGNVPSHLEAFEISEYGRIPTPEELAYFA